MDFYAVFDNIFTTDILLMREKRRVLTPMRKVLLPSEYEPS